MKEITVFTDGASRGNPGNAGYGLVVLYHDDNKIVEQGGRMEVATNNQMELMAAIHALRLLKNEDAEIHVYTDSAYVLNGATKWIYGWEKNNWKTSTKTDVENKELWKELAIESRAMKGSVLWKKIKGHSGIFGNELADSIATQFADGKKVLLFKGSLDDHKALKGGDLLTTSNTMSISKKSTKESKGKTPYSYVSMIDGVAMTHKTWTECEKRVKGKKAQFKKVFSKEEEQELIQEWTLASLLG